jgi:N-acetylneuraminic acid mutarotase
MVYDTESDRVILYGGAISDERLEDPIIRSKNDTWAYDYNTNTWTRMADGPEDSIGARMAYDAESDRAILFGGIAWMGDGWDLRSDTWAYDFNSDTWTEMKLIIKPPAWNFQGMAYDAKSDRVLMEMAPDIWSYDFNTNTWEKLENSEGQRPLSRDNPDMVYDAESDRMVLYGGEPGGNETWSYDYNTKTWTKMEPATVPGKVHGQAMVYNNTADRVILFGGKIGSVPYKYSGLTWSYDLNTDTWENVTPLP